MEMAYGIIIRNRLSVFTVADTYRNNADKIRRPRIAGKTVARQGNRLAKLIIKTRLDGYNLVAARRPRGVFRCLYYRVFLLRRQFIDTFVDEFEVNIRPAPYNTSGRAKSCTGLRLISFVVETASEINSFRASFRKSQVLCEENLPATKRSIPI